MTVLHWVVVLMAVTTAMYTTYLRWEWSVLSVNNRMTGIAAAMFGVGVTFASAMFWLSGVR